MAEQAVAIHGRDITGSTAGRPDNAYGGAPYFDVDTGDLLYWDSEANEWRPMGMPSLANAAAAPAGLKAMKGAMIFDEADSEVKYSDGVVFARDTDEQSSSSTSSSST